MIVLGPGGRNDSIFHSGSFQRTENSFVLLLLPFGIPLSYVILYLGDYSYSWWKLMLTPCDWCGCTGPHAPEVTCWLWWDPYFMALLTMRHSPYLRWWKETQAVQQHWDGLAPEQKIRDHVHSLLSNGVDKFILDSGSDRHFLRERDLFIELNETSLQGLRCANGTITSAVAERRAILNVLYCRKQKQEFDCS